MKSPCPIALVASTAPTRSPRASRASRASARAAPRPATMAGRARGEQVRDRGDGTLRRTRRLQRWPVREVRWAVGAMLFDHVDRDAQDDGAALGLRAPERPGGIGGGGLGPAHALGDRAERRREGALIHFEVRPERPGRDVRGQHDERRAGLCGLRQPRERVGKARALWTLATPTFPQARA